MILHSGQNYILPRRCWLTCHRHASGQALIEMALVLPLLLFLLIGGMSLFVRNLYRDSLDEAAEQAAWTAARTGGDRYMVQDAIQRAIPFVAIDDLQVSARSTGYHEEVAVTIVYQGTAISSLPFFNQPLASAQASATNQQEVAFSLQLGKGSLTSKNDPVSLSPARDTFVPDATDMSAEKSPTRMGPSDWPQGPALLRSAGTTQ